MPASIEPTTREEAIQLVQLRAAALKLKRHARTTETGPQDLTQAMVWAYRFNVSLRELAEQSGRSYGCVHRWLTKSGVQFRGRGGGRRKSVNN